MLPALLLVLFLPRSIIHMEYLNIYLPTVLTHAPIHPSIMTDVDILGRPTGKPRLEPIIMHVCTHTHRHNHPNILYLEMGLNNAS